MCAPDPETTEKVNPSQSLAIDVGPETAGWNMRDGMREGAGGSRGGSVGRTGSQKARVGVLPDGTPWEPGTEDLRETNAKTWEGSWLDGRWDE